MSENLNSEITQRFIDELERKKLKAKTLSRNIGAHENTLGNYVRNKVPDQWVYLNELQKQSIFVMCCLE